MRPHILRSAWISAAILAAAGTTDLAAQTRTIQGVVQDSATGERLPFAAVSIPGTNLQTRANREGFFALFGAGAESVDIRIAYVGFSAVTITVPSWRTDRIIVGLTRIPFRLDDIAVVADDYRMIEATRGVSQIVASPEDLAMLPSIGEADIFRSLQLLPGISGTNESSSGLYVRGGTPDQNLVLLDGMTVYYVDHFFGFFSAFNSDAIKDVQVYKGAYPAQFGGRVSSVVDMTGKSGDMEQFHGGVGANLLSANAVAQVPLWGKGSIIVTSRRSYTDVLQTGLYNSIFNLFNPADSQITQANQPPGPGGGGPGGGGQRRPGGGGAGLFQNSDFGTVRPDFYFYDVNAKLTYRPTVNDVMAVTVYNGQDYLDNSRTQLRSVGGQQGVTRNIGLDVADFTDWGNKGVSGSWSRQWHPRFFSTGQVAYSEYFSDYSRVTDLEVRDAATDTLQVSRRFGSTEDNLVTDFTARLDNQFQLFQSHQMEFGAWTTWSEVDYAFVRNDTVTILDQSQRSARVAGYLQDKWNVFRPLTLTLGGRVAYYDQTDRTYLEPRVSLQFEVSDRIRLKAAAGKYHQFVNRVVNENVTEGSRDFWLLADGNLVDVTSSKHYVAGLSYETDAFLFDVELYRKTTAGLSEFSLRFQRARDPDPLNLFFERTGVAQGAEFLLQKKFGVLTGWASYTLAKVEHTFPQLNDGDPFPALHDQRHELKLVGLATLGKFSLSATWAYATGKPYTAPESEYSITLLDGREQSYTRVSRKNVFRLPAYHRLDTGMHYRFRVGQFNADLGASVFNLYNRTNVWYREFDLNSDPLLVTDVSYLGMTPNISFKLGF